jgi:tripartite-type tricarboxylate transporter receptor subunit TctC
VRVCIDDGHLQASCWRYFDTILITLGRTLLAAALAFAPSVQAQERDYPGNPIKIVVPAAPGATTDALARIIADQLQRKWGQPVIVDNRAGAAGKLRALAVGGERRSPLLPQISSPQRTGSRHQLHAKLASASSAATRS